MRCIRSLFWLSGNFNFRLTALYLPEILNIAADSASRLSSHGYPEMSWPFTDYLPLHLHMPPKPSFFCLTDSQTGVSVMASGVVRDLKSLSNSLNEEALHYRANIFSISISKTYSTQCAAFSKMCADMGIRPVPLSQADLGRYVAFFVTSIQFYFC